MKRSRLAFMVLAALLVAACGQVSELKPAPGQSLPVKPLLARSTPDAADLLTPPSYARPQRVDELMKRSAPREPDRFDLPPPNGGLAPLLPETEEPSTTEQPQVADPQ